MNPNRGGAEAATATETEPAAISQGESQSDVP